MKELDLNIAELDAFLAGKEAFHKGIIAPALDSRLMDSLNDFANHADLVCLLSTWIKG